jgi:hypothetical protein
VFEHRATSIDSIFNCETVQINEEVLPNYEREFLNCKQPEVCKQVDIPLNEPENNDINKGMRAKHSDEIKDAKIDDKLFKCVR